MAKTRQVSVPERRIPRQQRALAKVEVILEAGAQILESGGLAAFTTNRVAERAGVGVSTLYQYFDGKQAVLVALARRELDRHAAAVTQALSAALEGRASGGQRATEPDRLAIRALIGVYATRRDMRRIAFDTLVAAGLGQELARPVEAVAALLAGDDAALFPARLSPLRLFVLTSAINGALAAAARGEAKHLATPAFEEELVSMVRAYAAEPGAPLGGVKIIPTRSSPAACS